MRTSMLAALTMFAITLTGCEPSTTVRAQATVETLEKDECPPLAKARELGLLQEIVIASTGKPPHPCDGKGPCRIKVNVKLDEVKKVCVATVEHAEIVIPNNAEPPAKKGERRGKVPLVTWELALDPNVGDAKFEFYDPDGIRFLKPRKPDETANDRKQDFDKPSISASRRFRGRTSTFATRSCATARMYFASDKNPPEECVGGDPLILNQ